jgi:hypothetical protein
MAYFDRFDVCAAHYWYAILYSGGQGCPLYARLSRILSFYRPDRGTEYGELTANAREIFVELVTENQPAGYCDCACRDCVNGPIVGHEGVTMCDECVAAGCEFGRHECQVEGAYGGEVER